MFKKLLGIILILSLIGVTAGCSKTDVSSEFYTIGVAAPITGNFSEYGKGFDVAANMAADEINAAGGINGKLVRLVVMDSKGDPKEATEIARKFTENKDIIGVIGDFSSSNAMAASPIYTEAKMVQLSPTASHPDFASMSEYMFSIMGRQDSEGPFVAEFLAQKYLGAKKAAIIYLNNDWGVSAHSNIIKRANEIGLEITAVENFVDGEKDFTATLSKIRQTKPDTLILVMFYNELVIISKQIKQMGWDDIKIGALGPGISDQIVKLGGSDVEGIVTSTPFMVSPENARAYNFANEFESKAGFTLNVHSAVAYDALHMMAEAIKRLGDNATRELISKELLSMEDFEGVTGPIVFSPAGDVTRKYLIAQIVDNKWVQVTDYNYGN